MRTFLTALLFTLTVVGLGRGQQKKPSDSTQASSTQQPTTQEPATAEAIQQFNDEKLADLEMQIAGKEKQPAGAVFKNIKMLTGVPAGNLLKIMQIGYSRSLGVSCAHCHVPGQWDKDDKAPKQITRDMSKMSRTINTELLKNIEGLKDRTPVVNCTTCHRGQVKPALDLDDSGAKK